MHGTLLRGRTRELAADCLSLSPCNLSARSQAVASAVLAPSLRHVADSLSLSWRRQLTAAAHQRYLARINFYTVSQLAGMQVRGD